MIIQLSTGSYGQELEYKNFKQHRKGVGDEKRKRKRYGMKKKISVCEWWVGAGEKFERLNGKATILRREYTIFNTAAQLDF